MISKWPLLIASIGMKKRNIYRECVDLEMMAYKRYHGNFDNLFISEMFCQVARLESLLKESVKNE